MGFGPFGPVRDNPARRLALAVDGAGDRAIIVGRPMPVSFRRAVARTLEEVAQHQPEAVLGIGVARRRASPESERYAHRRTGPHPDIDGLSFTLHGPPRLRSTFDPAPFLPGCGHSDDAGSYVCNAWLYQMLQQGDRPVGFLHIPPRGVEAAWLARGLDAWAARSAVG